MELEEALDLTQNINFKMTNKWKTLAIVLIIILVVENLLFFWILSLGLSEIEREEECGEVICIDDDAFYYDSIED
ncbi:unnamed protein product [marine sediment metagenome]|uniref:Uncharacterized protein n=1 Tax=marine sediment metagenome TaxID=412755 RepID=X1BA19_9ZZZZ